MKETLKIIGGIVIFLLWIDLIFVVFAAIMIASGHNVYLNKFWLVQIKFIVNFLKGII